MALDGRRTANCSRKLSAAALASSPSSCCVQLARYLEKLAVARLPNLQKRARIQPPFHRTPLVEALFERLADQVFLQPLTAGVLQNASQPVQFLPVEAVQRILRIGHGALEI